MSDLREYYRKYYLANKEKYKEISRKYNRKCRLANKEAIKAKKINKNLSAQKDKKMLDNYIQNVWDTLKSF